MSSKDMIFRPLANLDSLQGHKPSSSLSGSPSPRSKSKSSSKSGSPSKKRGKQAPRSPRVTKLEPRALDKTKRSDSAPSTRVSFGDEPNKPSSSPSSSSSSSSPNVTPAPTSSPRTRRSSPPQRSSPRVSPRSPGGAELRERPTNLSASLSTSCSPSSGSSPLSVATQQFNSFSSSSSTSSIFSASPGAPPMLPPSGRNRFGSTGYSSAPESGMSARGRAASISIMESPPDLPSGNGEATRRAAQAAKKIVSDSDKVQGQISRLMKQMKVLSGHMNEMVAKGVPDQRMLEKLQAEGNKIGGMLEQKRIRQMQIFRELKRRETKSTVMFDFAAAEQRRLVAHIPVFEALYPSPRLEYFDDLKKEAADARISAWTKKAINIIEECVESQSGDPSKMELATAAAGPVVAGDVLSGSHMHGMPPNAIKYHLKKLQKQKDAEVVANGGQPSEEGSLAMERSTSSDGSSTQRVLNGVVPFHEKLFSRGVVIAGPDIYEGEQRHEDRLSARTISTYPNLIGTDSRMGDPICDRFCVQLLDDISIVAVADGCNWGEKPATAAEIAATTLVKYVGARQHRIGSDMRKAAIQILRGFSDAQDCIKAGKKDVFDSGSTTLIGAALMEMDPDTLQPSLAVDARTELLARELNDDDAVPFYDDCKQVQDGLVNGIRERRWGMIGAGVGDCKAYHWAFDTGKVSDITSGNRENQHDVRDCGGRLGPYLPGGKADLSNLEAFFCLCKEGDIFMFCSDGIHDNLDPEMLGVTPSELGLKPGENPKKPWKKVDNRLCQAAKQKFAEDKVEELLAEATKNGAKKVTPRLMVRTLIKYCVDTTSKARTFMETKTEQLPKDYKLYPGKMDHTTCVCLRVVAGRPQPPPRRNTGPLPPVVPASSGSSKLKLSKR
eukprot:TRINITY_DN1725_c0_g1_i1.p1 TRINITY_DN1725_c0_g1~~TRINITY_DN1725_c0_g1_i1.p1  ORF type:complete len:893 (-),score=194.36 TRINITY_DN1725_c0_g1_i1:65-2743(-)